MRAARPNFVSVCVELENFNCIVQGMNCRILGMEGTVSLHSSSFLHSERCKVVNLK